MTNAPPPPKGEVDVDKYRAALQIALNLADRNLFAALMLSLIEKSEKISVSQRWSLADTLLEYTRPQFIAVRFEMQPITQIEIVKGTKTMLSNSQKARACEAKAEELLATVPAEELTIEGIEKLYTLFIAEIMFKVGVTREAAKRHLSHREILIAIREKLGLGDFPYGNSWRDREKMWKKESEL